MAIQGVANGSAPGVAFQSAGMAFQSGVARVNASDSSEVAQVYARQGFLWRNLLPALCMCPLLIEARGALALADPIRIAGSARRQRVTGIHL
jgi:hypothetical protein